MGEVGCRGDNNQPKTSHRKRRAITESRLAFNPVGRRNAMTDAMGKWDLVAQAIGAEKSLIKTLRTFGVPGWSQAPSPK